MTEACADVCKCPEPTYRWDHDLCSGCGAQIGEEHSYVTRICELEAQLADERTFGETLVNLVSEEALGWRKHLSADVTRSMRARAETCEALARSMRAKLAERIAKRSPVTPEKGG